MHCITLPLLGLTPPIFQLPWYEHVSEFFGHAVWFWAIEVFRRDPRNRLTDEPDSADRPSASSL
ncbi:DUF1440 domain-containing protein [uncultured Campylobacter sp.]|uniref:DUF1440 domain-containing protein n=1 Tax=uncultured Campylobacter sp. TaxID=218934 RepID=UPI002625F09C|nr:DUF1440 domain-containing protein [uncultured Campylobacter sp.]